MQKQKKVFLVGVGGIGVSAVAKYLVKEGYEIFGSNLEKGENVEELEKKFRLHFFKENNKTDFQKIFTENDFEFLIYTPAVKANYKNIFEHQVLKVAQKMKVPVVSYAEYLGEMSKNKFTISIAGTNGKTTTTTMLTEVMDFLGLEPNAIVGGIMKKFNSNFLAGESNKLILESCEYQNSFLNLYPDIAVITNITPDHLDFFGTFENYQKVFIDFVKNIKEGGILVCNTQDKNLQDVLLEAKKKNLKIINYTEFLENLNLKIPGEYNRENAAAVLAVITEILNCNFEEVKLKISKAQKYLENDFSGSQRRLEFIGKTEQGTEVYDDYAHNPEGIELLISGLQKKYPQKKIIIIFQPHLYSRTKDFQNEFAQALSLADEIYLLPIYAAREKEDLEISSKILAQIIKKIFKKNNLKKKIYTPNSLEECILKVKKENYDKDNILITVGAGDVYKVGKKIV